jgi:hypothetical protein
VSSGKVRKDTLDCCGLRMYVALRDCDRGMPRDAGEREHITASQLSKPG